MRRHIYLRDPLDLSRNFCDGVDDDKRNPGTAKAETRYRSRNFASELVPGEAG